jgi:hypothetical protein
MAKISEKFAGSYFKVEDFTAIGTNLVIESVDEEMVGDDEKLVARFVDVEKSLPLNKTNAIDISQLYGDDTDDWTGHTVNVYRSSVMFKGKKTPCLCVREPRTFSDSSQAESGAAAAAGETAPGKGKGKSKS